MADFTADDCHDVQWFEKNRPEIFNFVKNIDQDIDFQSKPFHHIILVAPVKSGKREIMETFLRRNNSGSGRKIKHFYLSALNRKDDKPQLEELRAYGFSVYLSSAGQQLVDEITAGEDTYDKFIIHFNESDYGTGTGQLTSKFFNHLVKNPKVQIIAYSATNEEAEHSSFAKRYKCKTVTFIPPTIYCGTKWYLQNGRVKEAETFWDEKTSTLSKQGIECCELLKNSNKVFGVVRFPSAMSSIKASGMFENEIKSKYGFRVQFIDAKDSFDWGKNGDWYKAVGIFADTGVRTILAICQTATRSTELKFHRHIRFWHGSPRKSAYNTIIQADGRPIFYNTEENSPITNPVDITIYTNVAAFKRNAEYTPVCEYEGKLSGRMTATVNSKLTKWRQEVHWFNYLPSLAEINAFAKNKGAFCNYTESFNRTVSKNKDDLAEMVLNPGKSLIGSGPANDGSNGRISLVLYFDSISANPTHKNAWINDTSIVGKYAVILEFEEQQPTGVIHLTTKRSMFEVV